MHGDNFERLINATIQRVIQEQGHRAAELRQRLEIAYPFASIDAPVTRLLWQRAVEEHFGRAGRCRVKGRRSRRG